MLSKPSLSLGFFYCRMSVDCKHHGLLGELLMKTVATVNGVIFGIVCAIAIHIRIENEPGIGSKIMVRTGNKYLLFFHA